MPDYKPNYRDFQREISRRGIRKLYHFTDRSNLRSIRANGGLIAWSKCEEDDIEVNRPGGSDTSHHLDYLHNIAQHVHLSFTPNHPMMFVARNDGRITDPVLLEIDPEVIYWRGTKFSDMNAVRNGANLGAYLTDFQQIHFGTVRQPNHFDLDDDEKPYYQAEVLVKHFIPLRYILNIEDV